MKIREVIVENKRLDENFITDAYSKIKNVIQSAYGKLKSFSPDYQKIMGIVSPYKNEIVNVVNKSLSDLKNGSSKDQVKKDLYTNLYQIAQNIVGSNKIEAVTPQELSAKKAQLAESMSLNEGIIIIISGDKGDKGGGGGGGNDELTFVLAAIGALVYWWDDICDSVDHFFGNIVDVVRGDMDPGAMIQYHLSHPLGLICVAIVSILVIAIIIKRKKK